MRNGAGKATTITVQVNCNIGNSLSPLPPSLSPLSLHVCCLGGWVQGGKQRSLVDSHTMIIVVNVRASALELFHLLTNVLMSGFL